MENAPTQFKNVKSWTYEESVALISAYQNRKEEYLKTSKKKHFWDSILMDLETSNVLVSPTTSEHVETKWRCLYRTYKSAKSRGIGKTKFMYMDEMDAIFHDSPIISLSISPYTVSAGVEYNPFAAPRRTKNVEGIEVSNNAPTGKESLIEIKREYYERLLEEKRKKRELLESYLKKKEKLKRERHQEIINLLKGKSE